MCDTYVPRLRPPFSALNFSSSASQFQNPRTFFIFSVPETPKFAVARTNASVNARSRASKFRFAYDFGSAAPLARRGFKPEHAFAPRRAVGAPEIRRFSVPEHSILRFSTSLAPVPETLFFHVSQFQSPRFFTSVWHIGITL